MAAKMYLGFFVFAMIGCIVSVCSATTHNVGEGQGWSAPITPCFYQEWAKNKTFVVGDVLFFSYKAGLNTVVQVDKEDFDGCTSRHTIASYYEGDTRVTLDKAGDYFFFCTVGKRCEAGQKLSITVVAHGNTPSAPCPFN